MNQEELQALLAKVPAQKSLILLDTCYAGAFTEMISQGDVQKTGLDRLDRLPPAALLYRLSVSMQVALEGYQGHGVFTHSLLRGLQGDADRVYGNDDGEIDIQELGRSIEALVPQISRKLGAEQTPYTSDLRGVKFSIARIGN